MATLKHPDLPGQLVTYPDDAVPILQASGWVDAYGPDAETELVVEPNAEATTRTVKKPKREISS